MGGELEDEKVKTDEEPTKKSVGKVIGGRDFPDTTSKDGLFWVFCNNQENELIFLLLSPRQETFWEPTGFESTEKAVMLLDVLLLLVIRFN